jgi:hypothetical protein
MITITKLDNEYILRDDSDNEIYRTDRITFMCDMITVKRELGNPGNPVISNIVVYKNNDSIGVKIDLDEFVKQLGEEFGTAYMTYTKGQVKSKLKLAVDKIISGAKDETRRVAHLINPGT